MASPERDAPPGGTGLIFVIQLGAMGFIAYLIYQHHSRQKPEGRGLADRHADLAPRARLSLVDDLQLTPWRPEHAPVLEEVLGPSDELARQMRELHGPDADGARWRRTVVAEHGAVPIGVVTVLAPRWHAERLWVGVEVGPGHRRCGVGTTLLRAARELSRQDGRPLRGKVFEGSIGARFAEAHGFRVVQRSRTFRLSRPAPGVTAADLIIDAAPTPDRSAAAFRDFYVHSHDWDPPGDMSPADVRRTHVDDATAALLVLNREGTVLAVGCIYKEGGDLLLSGGPTAPDHDGAPAATGALLDAALAYSGGQGLPLLVEADDSPPQVVEELQLRGAAVLDVVHIVAER
jgi:GNAT superfamily N-acetyltransferase